MLEYTTSSYLTVIIITLLGVNLIFLILLLSKSQKNKKLTLSFEGSESTQQRVNDLIVSEMRPIILEANKKIQEHVEIIRASYQEQIEEVFQTMDSQSGNLLKDLSVENNKIKNNLEALNKRIENDFSTLHQTIIDKQKELYAAGEEQLAQEVLNIRKEHEQATQLLLKQAQEELKNSGQEFVKRLSPIYQEAVKNIEQKISLTQEEITNYKQERFKKLDEEIYQKLGQIAKETIGKVIDLSTHERLIKRALEKAKKEMF